ncbi:hypothetical protein GHK61_06155 [Sinorhizobium meliloti]|uniref:AbrB family transcriptional regulator n=1 Tax=Rhizobium meliloti TaxID=382 RepID=UPI0012976DE9|nr:hypothetical protein [Sinorhizobium meliloti]
MIACAVLCLGGVRLESPTAVRPVMASILGVSIGSSLNNDVIQAAADWLPSLLLMVPFRPDPFDRRRFILPPNCR